MSAPTHPGHVKPAITSRTLFIGLIFLCVIGLLLVVLPLFFRLERFSAAVLHQVEQRVGYAINVESMRITLIPRIGVELIDVRVSEASTTARIFSARRMHLEVQSLPLLRGDVIGTRLLIEQPHVELHRDKTGRWGLAPSAGRTGTEG